MFVSSSGYPFPHFKTSGRFAGLELFGRTRRPPGALEYRRARFHGSWTEDYDPNFAIDLLLVVSHWPRRSCFKSIGLKPEESTKGTTSVMASRSTSRGVYKRLQFWLTQELSASRYISLDGATYIKSAAGARLNPRRANETRISKILERYVRAPSFLRSRRYQRDRRAHGHGGAEQLQLHSAWPAELRHRARVPVHRQGYEFQTVSHYPARNRALGDCPLPSTAPASR